MQIILTMSYHYDSRKLSKEIVKEMCVVVWTLICKSGDLGELECLVVSTITYLNDYETLIGGIKSCIQRQVT